LISYKIRIVQYGQLEFWLSFLLSHVQVHLKNSKFVVYSKLVVTDWSFDLEDRL